MLASGVTVGVASDGGLPWYTMPFVRGDSLRARLVGARAAGTAMPVAEAVSLLRDVAKALAYAHAHGVVHRDIKPENILLSSGTAVVADFGIAKAIRRASTATPESGAAEAAPAMLTEAGIAMGTPAYMAPEQALGDDVAAAVDVYAWGVVAYELLAAEHPFEGRAGARALVAAHLSETAPPLAARAPAVPPSLAALVTRCLEKAPEDRPADGAALLSALDAAMRTSTTGATAPPPVHGLRRRRVRVVVITVTALIALGGAAAIFVPRDLLATARTLLTRPDAVLQPRRVVVAPLENRTGDSTLTPLGELAAEWMAQELTRTGEFEVVDARTAITTGALLARVPSALRDGSRDVALARETGAGRVVTGRIDVLGDSLRFAVQLVDASSGSIVRALPATMGSRAAPAKAVSELARRAVAALAATVDTSAGASAGRVGEPPSYEAYGEVSRAWESFFRGDRADFDARLKRAAALDSLWATPVLFAAWGAETDGQPARLDSLLRRVTRLEARLTPAERDLRDVLAASLAGDRPGALRAAQALLARAPGSVEVPLLVATLANGINRPRAALAALDRTDPARGLNLISPWYWSYRAASLHALGDHEAELTAVERGQRQFPGWELSWYQLRALAALGRMQDVTAMRAAMGARPTYVASFDLLVARELRAHGRGGDAIRYARTMLLQHAIDAAPAVVRDTGRVRTEARQRATLIAELLYEAERWDDVRRVLAPWMASTDGPAVIGRMGTVAARLGDRAAAQQALDRLAAMRVPYPYGRITIWRARINARLGDRVAAVSLLQQALAEGWEPEPESTYGLHLDADLHVLAGDPAFEAIRSPYP